MTERTIDDSLGEVRRLLGELDLSISQMRTEAQRLTASAKKRDSLIQLERAAEAKAAAKAAEAAAAAKNEALAREEAHRFAGVEADEMVAFGHVAAPEAPRRAVVKRTIAPTPMVLATPDEASRGHVAPDPEPSRASAEPASVPTPTGAADSGVVATAMATAAPMVTQSPEPAAATQSPLHALDDDIEAAFDRFFSAEVEPEPAQRWLLED